MENIRVSLITTLYNEADNIVRFLDSYKVQTKYADEFIIVDGGSTDNTIELIEQYIKENSRLNIKLIVDETCTKKHVAGPIAKGRNVAIKNAKYDYIAVTDAGCILDKHWFEEIIKPFYDPITDVVAGWYEAHIVNEFQKKYAEAAMPTLKSVDPKTFLPSSRSLAMKKVCWEKANYYPEKTLTGEDTLFDLTMEKEGCKFIFAEKAIVFWECPRSLSDAFNKHFSYSHGDGRLKQFSWRYFLKMFFIFFPVNILFSKRKRKHFFLSYIILIASQFGYAKGLLK